MGIWTVRCRMRPYVCVVPLRVDSLNLREQWVKEGIFLDPFEKSIFN